MNDLPLPVSGGRESDVVHRSQLSSLQALLVLAMVMAESGDEHKIVGLAGSSVPSLGRARFGGVYLLDGAWEKPSESVAPREVRADLEVQFSVINSAGGALSIKGEAWGWAFPLRSLDGHFGYLLVMADDEPSQHELFLLRVLAQQAGIAIGNARLHHRDRAVAAELRSANAALAETINALERSTAIHDRLTQIAASGEGQEGIAQAVHELTGYPVVIEDRYGNVRAQAGANATAGRIKDTRAARLKLLDRALAQGQPLRDRGRLIAIARPSEQVIGVLMLIDPHESAGEQEQVALEHGATVLAMELARLHSVGEAELRLRGDLSEELLAGTDTESALARAQGLGYDLLRPHRVVAVDELERNGDREDFFHAVRRTARDQTVGSLLTWRVGYVVLLSDNDVHWERFRSSVLTNLGHGRCRVGVGGVCTQASEFPRSFKEARFALKMQGPTTDADQATAFDDLGVFRILAGVDEPADVERFVQEWLGALLHYDSDKKSDLVTTLNVYLEAGGNYNTTSERLAVHRSTLKYRLQRIREISGHDLGNADTTFNLQLACRAWSTLQALSSA